jgi:hypothetical protein
MEHGDALGEVERHVHVVLDHHDRYVARDSGDEGQHVAALLERQAGEGLVEQQDAWVLGEGHGDLRAAALAVRRLGKGALGEVAEPDPREHLAGTGHQCRLPVESHERVPAERSEPEQ